VLKLIDSKARCLAKYWGATFHLDAHSNELATFAVSREKLELETRRRRKHNEFPLERLTRSGLLLNSRLD